MSGLSRSTSRRRLLPAAATVGLVVSVLELSACVFFRTFRTRFAWSEPEQYALSLEQAEGLARRFDPELGWAPRFDTPYGERPRSVHYPRMAAAAFGDSHVYGDEVGDDETWEVYLAATLGADVLNFGVGGFGPDQALLMARRKAGRPETPVVVLGVGLENINRVVNRYRPFYAQKTGIPMPKPRFVLEEGRLRLTPNPVGSASELKRLADPAFLHEIGQGDFWYARGGRPRLAFPYLRLAFDPELWRQALGQRRNFGDAEARPANLWRNEEAAALFLALLDAFVTEAQTRGERPLLLVSPGRVLVEAVREGRPIPGYLQVLDHCRSRGYDWLDGIAVLGRAHARPEALFAPGGHTSAEGNRLLAMALSPEVERLLRVSAIPEEHALARPLKLP